VIDVLLPDGPDGVDQRKVLGSFDAAAGTWARVPFVGGTAAPPPPAPTPPALTVADVADRTVTVAGDVTGLAPLMIGRVLDADGATVARIVVVRVLDKGFVADVSDGAEHIRRGATVVFPARAP